VQSVVAAEVVGELLRSVFQLFEYAFNGIPMCGVPELKL